MGFVGLSIRFEFGEVGGFDVGGLVVMTLCLGHGEYLRRGRLFVTGQSASRRNYACYSVVRVPAIEAVI